jgi:hypothetical protein
MKDCIMHLPDGRGFSPDSGPGEVKNNVIYWDDGDVTDLNVGGLAVRWMPEGGFNGHTRTTWRLK